MSLAFILLCLQIWLRASEETSTASRLGFILGFPLVALLGLAPWLVNNRQLLGPVSPSPYPADIGLLHDLVIGNGVVIVPLALWGIRIGLRERGIMRQVSLLMLACLLLIMELTLAGVIGRLLPPLGALVNAPNLARHGVILPLTWFAGLALLQLWDTKLPATLKHRLRYAANPLILACALAIIGLGVSFQPLLTVRQQVIDLPRETITHDDIEAMTWLRDHTPEDAVLLAADGEGWLPIYAQRRTVAFRAVAYFEWDTIGRAGAEPLVDFVVSVNRRR